MFIDEKETNNRLSSLDNLLNRLNGSNSRDNNINRVSSNSNSNSDSNSNSVPSENRKIHNGGRPKDRLNDTDDQRAEIGMISTIHGPNTAAKYYNTTPSRASLLSNGIITHGNGVDSNLHSKVKDKKEIVHEKALDIIMSSLGNIEDGLDSVKGPKDLSIIASNMAKIAERTGGRLNNVNDNAPKVQVIVYTPRIKSSDEYEEIEI